MPMQDVEGLVDVDVPPCWLHGDLTQANVLVREVGGASRVSLIDFGDCGHGDALFDFVPLHLVTFRYPLFSHANFNT
jgi:Ser/Thr protein kinase RdoA (MazF antagonist)